MRTWLLMVALGLVGSHTARASEPVISSLDLTGRLTFQQVPAAASYWVEWTTNLISTTWSSNAPGIATIPASGIGSLTVTVGLLHASCFYRVVASVTNPPLTSLTNAFDLSSENWLIVDYPFRSHYPNLATQSLPFDAAFGNPPGSVRVGDVFPETGIAAPAQYLGSKLSLYGGSLAYDIYLRYSDNTTYPAVFLNGGTKSVYYDAPSPPVNAWQHRTVPLVETGWIDTTTGEPATESVFKEVLSHLVGLYIYTEWHSGADDTNVDNITVTPP